MPPRRVEGRVHRTREAGQGHGFCAAALVELLLPDNVVGLFGALLVHLCLDAFRSIAAAAAPWRFNEIRMHHSGTVLAGGSPNRPAQKS